MASVFTQDSVLHFLQSSGGSVKNADLLLHFRNFLRDSAERNRNRELFKGFVNSVATVKQIDGVSHVVLRKKFRRHEEDSSGPPPVPPNPPDSTEHQQKLQQNQDTAPTQSSQDQRTKVLPAAGIIQLDDSNVETPLNLKHKQPAPVNTPPEPSAGPGPKQPESQVSEERQESTLSLPEHCASFQSIRVGEQRLHSAPFPNDPPARLHKEIRDNPPNQVCLHPPFAPQRIRHRQSYKSAISQDEDEEEEEEDILLRTASAGETSINSPSNHKGRGISASSPCLIDLSGPLSCSFTSSEKNLPQIYIQPIEGEIRPPQSPSEVGLKEELHRSKLKVGSAMAISHNLSSEPQCFSPPPAQVQKSAERHDSYWDQEYTPPSRAQLETRPRSDETQRLPSSSSTNVTPLADTRLSSSNWLLFDSSRTPGKYSSSVDLETREGQPVGVPMFQNPQNQQSQKREQKVVMHHDDSKSRVLRHHSTDDLYDDQQLSVHMSPLYCSTDQFHDNQHLTVQMKPWHLSTGDLYDDCSEGELNNASISPPQYWQQSAVTRQINSHLRSRMCLSLGADLDQLYQMEERGGGANEAARLNRLHQISSSLSLRHNLSSSSLSSCATPPRCHSPALRGDGEERTGGRRNFPTATPSFTAYHGGQSPVPLEPREHAWMVKGAEGAWPDIYLLFREDSSLLNRRDFISGFTVLHWIAKHGDHRVLNTLWYGVEKAGLAFDVNAKSTGGQTALHVAAIHGNKNVIRLLVKKFNADVKLRDTAGKRPWQYLSNTSVDILELLGAAARAPVTTERVTGKAESGLQLQQQRRRRRHHLSSASSEDRLLKVSGMTKVKRSSSIAAFFKHRSLHRFYGNQAESAV